MEPSAIFFLVISCIVSFTLGRTFVHFRNKKRDRIKREQEAEARRNQPPEKVSLNKAKRKRQLQQAGDPSKSRLD